MDQLFNYPSTSSISSPDADLLSGSKLPLLDRHDRHVLPVPAVKGDCWGGCGSGSSSSLKKLSHNAYERERRKELNELYSKLRSLLPDANSTKKLSIASTVCRAVKYISELRRQVDMMERRKKQLTTTSCKAGVMKTNDRITPVVSATCLNDMELTVAVSLLSNVATTDLPLSVCIKVLEKEGLQLLSTSTYSTNENRTFYSLHFQRRQRALDKECQLFCDQLEEVVRKRVGLYLQQ